MTVFKFLKDHLGDVLFQRNNILRLKLSKVEFGITLSIEDVWKKSFSIENIQKGLKNVVYIQLTVTVTQRNDLIPI